MDRSKESKHSNFTCSFCILRVDTSVSSLRWFILFFFVSFFFFFPERCKGRVVLLTLGNLTQKGHTGKRTAHLVVVGELQNTHPYILATFAAQETSLSFSEKPLFTNLVWDVTHNLLCLHEGRGAERDLPAHCHCTGYWPLTTYVTCHLAHDHRAGIPQVVHLLHIVHGAELGTHRAWAVTGDSAAVMGTLAALPSYSMVQHHTVPGMG